MLEDWPGGAIRLLLLSAHYRAPLDFSQDGLREAKAQLDRLYQALRSATAVASEQVQPSDAVLAALCDDLNTPLALSALHDAAGRLNKATTPGEASTAKAELLAGGAVLGILQQDPEAWFKGGGDLDPAAIEQQIKRARMLVRLRTLPKPTGSGRAQRQMESVPGGRARRHDMAPGLAHRSKPPVSRTAGGGRLATAGGLSCGAVGSSSSSNA